MATRKQNTTGNGNGNTTTKKATRKGATKKAMTTDFVMVNNDFVMVNTENDTADSNLPVIANSNGIETVNNGGNGNNSNTGNAVNFNTQVLINGLKNATCIETLPSVIDSIFKSGFTAINAKAAYAFANGLDKSDNAYNAATQLASCMIVIARLFELTGKNAGISTIYNVLDARIVRKVVFTKKLAFNLGNSKALATFANIMLASDMTRIEHGHIAKSVNGIEYEQNRNTYTTTKGKIENLFHASDTVTQAQYEAITKTRRNAIDARQAIQAGKAMSLTSKPSLLITRKLNKLWATLTTAQLEKAINFDAPITSEKAYAAFEKAIA